MLSKTSARLLVFSVKWTSFWGGMPYAWDDRRAKIRLCRRNQRKWYFWTSFLALMTLYNCLRLVHTFKSRDSTLIEKTKSLLVTMISVISVMFTINSWLHHLDMACFVNSYIKFAQHYRNAYVKKLGRGWRNGCEPFLRVFSVLSLLIPILPAILYIYRPTDPMYLTSLLPLQTPRTLHVIICIIFGTLHVLWFLTMSSTGLFYMFANFLPAYLLNGVIPESMPGGSGYVTKPLVRRPPRLCQLYRSYQIFEGLLNDGISDLLFPFKVTAILFEILCTASLVKFWRGGTLVGKFFLVVLSNTYLLSWLVTVALSGSILRRTAACINSWKGMKLKLYRDVLYMRKFKRSCLPIRIRLGGFCVVKSAQIIITLHSVLRNFLKLLLAMDKAS